MFEDLLEQCKEVVKELDTNEGKVDYDKLRTEILIMLNDPKVTDEKIFRSLGRRYDEMTIRNVLDAMRKKKKNLGPLDY